MNDPNPYRPGNAPIQNQQPQQEQWRWRYSPLVGVMYGPIPVGIIVVAIGFIAYYATQ
jgi:hypothetical protein